MLTRFREVKYGVGADWTMPDLTSVLPIGAQSQSTLAQTSSLYFDTSDRALLGHQVTLHSSSGDADEGWNLTIHSDQKSLQVREPSDSEPLPIELRRLVVALRSGQKLRPTVRMDRQRSVCRFVGADDTVLLEVADDQVTASRTGRAAATTSWREIQIGFSRGNRALSKRLGRALIAAGASRRQWDWNLRSAFAGERPALPTIERDESPLRNAIADYLDAQCDALLTADVKLRCGSSPIHSARVAVRRYRSVLRTFADILDPDRAAWLSAELRWFADLMGAVRDPDVIRGHLTKSVRRLEPALAIGTSWAAIEERLSSDELAARNALDRAMIGRRYLALVAELHSWHEQVPFRAEAEGSATSLVTYLKQANQKLRKELTKAKRAGSADAQQHRARRMAKRARYIGELATPLLGRPARRTVRRATHLQDVLGRHQDDVVVVDFLAQFGAEADSEDAPGAFSIGLLYADALRRVDRSRRRVRAIARNGR
jgi:CHAD domain-containing protein